VGCGGVAFSVDFEKLKINIIILFSKTIFLFFQNLRKKPHPHTPQTKNKT